MPAIMIPAEPKEYDPRSKEGVIFNAFKKLPSDYYVFHSYHVVTVDTDHTVYDREMDFVIVHRKKGILALEAKAGNYITYENRTWTYSSGKVMKHGGPYNQVATAMRTLRDEIKNHPDLSIRCLLNRIKFLSGVIFPDLTYEDFNRFVGLPEECSADITILAEDLKDPTRKIESMFALKPQYYEPGQEPLNEEEFKLLLNTVLCPHFKIIPSPEARNILLGEHLNQLLHEQAVIFDFLEEQPCAVINGAAGTGKTMLAVEKAKSHSKKGQKVLFLCYNSLLRKKLTEDFKESEDKNLRKECANIDFLTISQLALRVTGDYTNFDGLSSWVDRCINKQSELGYQHIIVDEGQDFAIIEKDVEGSEDNAYRNVDLLDKLQLAAIEQGGTFYLFYDKYQMIEGKEGEDYIVPDCIDNAECRLTLHKNCRNTNEIARTSVTPLRDRKNKAVKPAPTCAWNDPVVPCMHLVSRKKDVVDALNKILEKLEAEHIDDIVLLTTGTLESTCLSSNLKVLENEENAYRFYQHNGIYYPLTTCKKYKGLEADAIIMLDLEKDSFNGKQGMKFYVGSSRAKIHLDFICRIAEQDYYEVVHALDPNAPRRTNGKRMRAVLANTFAAEVVEG